MISLEKPLFQQPSFALAITSACPKENPTQDEASDQAGEHTSYKEKNRSQESFTF
jgi:hypothetical protein